MPSTASGLVYPVLTAPPNVPSDIQALANSIETAIAGKVVLPCTSTTRPSSPTVGRAIYETDTKREYRWNGSIWTPISGAYQINVINPAWSPGVTLSDVPGANFTIPAGTWLITAEVFFQVSTSVNTGYSIAVFNTTSSVNQDQVSGSIPTGNFSQTLTTTFALALTASASMKIQASTSTVNGTQTIAVARIIAAPQLAIN